MAIAERLGDATLAEELLRRAIAKAPHGDAPLGWALIALAGHRAAAGDLAEAADLKERAARDVAPDRERALLLEVAALAAGPLGDLGRAARLYEELRAREPADPEIWQPLAEVYKRARRAGARSRRCSRRRRRCSRARPSARGCASSARAWPWTRTRTRRSRSSRRSSRRTRRRPRRPRRSPGSSRGWGAATSWPR